MGIGRFAFTPILPMMQADHGISVAQGSWLASANYLGYLVGSLIAMHPGIPARAAIRSGLVLIAASTLAMGADHHFAAWLILRGVAGIASALVMIAVSAWILPRLAQAARENLSGTVYAGVGAGIVYAGVVSSAAAAERFRGQRVVAVGNHRRDRHHRGLARGRRRRRDAAPQMSADGRMSHGRTSGWCSATARTASATSSRPRSCR